MKGTKAITSLLLLIAVLTGCGNEGNQLIKVDVNANYPKKNLTLQNFADVEYIPLETNDDFVTQGDVMAIGDQYILAKNWTADGDIFVFDRKTGKAIRKINRKGQGAEEYNFINGVVMDEANNEMFVNCTPMKKILVYDLFGSFKRSFNYKKDAEYLNVYDYDRNNLICYDISLYYKDGKSHDGQCYHAIISKKNGSVTRNILIPFDKIKAPFVKKGDGVAVSSVCPMVPYHDNWLLIETSTDTVYIMKGSKLSPFLVKTPSKDPVIFLTMGTLTDRYYFMQTVKREFDFTTGKGFPLTDLVYDKQENVIFEATVYNGDCLNKQEMDMISHPLNGKIAAYQTLAANKLVEAYNNHELKGKLNEIASTLNEESNPVVVIMKYKGI